MTADAPPAHPPGFEPDRDRGERPVVLSVALPVSNRAALSFALGNLGFVVVHAADAEAALTVANEQAPAAVVLNVAAPGMHWSALLEQLERSSEPPPATVLFAETRRGVESARLADPNDAGAAARGPSVVGPGEHARLAQAVISALPPERRPRPDPSARRILVADDDPVHRKLLQLRLLRLGFVVLTAEDGALALERARRSRPDAIIADVLMPGLDGFRLCLAVRQDSALANTPVVLSTASVPEELDLLLAQNVGANALVLRAQDRADEADALLSALHEGAPPTRPPPAPLALEQHAHRMIRQLERQVGLLRVAERSLRESEERYRLVLEGADEGFWDWDLSTDEMYWNPRLLQTVGLGRHAFGGTGSAVDQLIHPDDRAAHRDALQAHLARGIPYEVELRLAHASGGWRTVVLRGKARFDEGGRASRMAGTAADVTERRRTEAAQRLFAEVSAVLGPTLDVDATLPTVVKLMAAHFGGPCAIDALDQREPLRRFAAGGEPLEDAERIPLLVRERRAGTLLLPAPPADPAERSAREATAHEIARRISAALDGAWLYRRARDAVHARDEFLSIASHELKTPLTSLQLHLQSLLAGARAGTLPAMEPARVVHKLDTAERQTRRLTKLVNELLDVSRIVNGRLELSREEVDLAAVVHELAARYADDLHNAGCALEIESTGIATGHWDRMRVEQVFLNLLGNAMKYGGGRPINVRVSADAERATLSVRDFGIGIDPDRLPHIFDRFERAVSSRHYGGLGLGLYIVRQIVEAHGGTIDVQSEPGVGSTFTVVLPRAA